MHPFVPRVMAVPIWGFQGCSVLFYGFLYVSSTTEFLWNPVVCVSFLRIRNLTSLPDHSDSWRVTAWSNSTAHLSCIVFQHRSLWAVSLPLLAQVLASLASERTLAATSFIRITWLMSASYLRMQTSATSPDRTKQYLNRTVLRASRLLASWNTHTTDLHTASIMRFGEEKPGCYTLTHTDTL